MTEEKIFTIPLRKAFRGHRKRRAKKAITLIREFLERHMKSKNINIGKSINESVWARGIQKPPRRVRIHVLLENDIVYSELVGTDIKPASKEALKEKEKKKAEKKNKIREERKERKKMSIQDEIEEESGKKDDNITAAQESDALPRQSGGAPETVKEKMEAGDESKKGKETGKA